MSQYIADAKAEVEIEKYDQLVEYFENSCKPRERWRIGTEYEKVAVLASNGQAAPFTGGIEEVLRRMADRYPWTPIVEEGRIVALSSGAGGAAITLEPGGQLELSGEQCDSVHCAAREFHEHVHQIVSIGKELGIVFLGLGMQPISRLEEIEWVPKKRYGIMGPYMLEVGTLGQRMMKQTATVQVNFDYSSERDATNKVRTGMGLAPILNAMFANSPICDGNLNGYMSFRGHIWTDTDNNRSGLLPWVFQREWGFANYVEYALDVPMYFIVRDGEWSNMTAMTFRQFWNDGYRSYRANMSDWNAHLTTLFPETRMKGYIEIRSIDSQAPEMMLAVPAIVKGLFYDADCLGAAWDLVKSWTWEERLTLWRDAHKGALRAKIRTIELRELAREVIDIAETGLNRQRRAGEESEAMYLERLRDEVRRGRCPADLLVEKWNSTWAQQYSGLVEGSAYSIAA